MVQVDVDGPVTRLALDRPDRRNALSLEMMRDFVVALDGLDDSSAVVVVEARGPAFSAGHDLAEMTARDDAFYAELFAACTEMMLRLHELPQPVIAHVHGVATAAGCQLVAACDLAVAADTATFATPGVRIGLFCSTPMVPLTRAIGRKRALQMLLTGEAVDAATALDWGLVNQVVPAEQLDAAVDTLIGQILRSSPARHRARQAGVLRPDRTRRTRRLRARAARDGCQRGGRRRPGGHRGVPREAPAGVAGYLSCASR